MSLKGAGEAGGITVRVPATSANLGPGFDSFGLALGLYDVVTAQIRPEGLAIEVSGAGAETASAAEQHLVVRAMRTAFAHLGAQPPGLTLACVNEIPQGFGLGSSAGAIVAGLLAARALAAAESELTDQDILRLATRMEGHPDNVAACLAGGLTIAWTPVSATPGAQGARVARLTPLPGIGAVLCVPGTPVLTSAARAVLPAEVPHAAAAANSARAALLVAALTARPDLLMDATEDFLHQRYRAPAMPATATLIDALRTAGIPAVVSGAGPSVLAFVQDGTGPKAGDISAIAGPDWQVQPLAIDTTGATVLPA
jgi:homoserine kinase